MSFGKNHIAKPHGREWTRLLHVLQCLKCPLQMSPTTQLMVCYIHTPQTDILRRQIPC